MARLGAVPPALREDADLLGRREAQVDVDLEPASEQRVGISSERTTSASEEGTYRSPSYLVSTATSPSRCRVARLHEPGFSVLGTCERRTYGSVLAQRGRDSLERGAP